MVQKQKGAQQGRSICIARLLATLGLTLKKSRGTLTLLLREFDFSSFNGSTQIKIACGAKHSIRYSSAIRQGDGTP
jgi:hypothetical protein